MMETAQHPEDWRSLHEQLRGIARRRAALDAEEARCLREAYAKRLWRRLGYAHMNEYLERELGYSPQVGIERLRVAHALGELPQIEASLDAGRLAFSAVRELTRVATADTEQDWLDKVRGKNLREIEAMVSGKKRGAHSEDPSNPDLTLRVVRLELAPAVFALLRQTQSAMADEHGGRLDDSALIEILCRRTLEGSGQADRPAYQLAITQCEGCGRAWQNGAGREVDVGREVAERARCDAELLGSLEASDPERVRTTVTLRVRRQVFARDHYRCTVPGCRSARNLDIHHVEYQSHGGGHEIQNLTVLCSAHHASLHENRLTIRGTAPDALEFTWREPIGPAEPDIHLSPRGRGPDVDAGDPHVSPGELDVHQSHPQSLENVEPGTGQPVTKVSPSSADAFMESPPTDNARRPADASMASAPTDNARRRANASMESAPTDNARRPADASMESVPTDNARRPADASMASPPTDKARRPADASMASAPTDKARCPADASMASAPTDNARRPADASMESAPTDNARRPADASMASAPTHNARRRPRKIQGPSAEAAAWSDLHVNAPTIDEEACLALITAGYRSRQARAAVESARPHVGASATLEQVIREALRQCRLGAATCR